MRGGIFAKKIVRFSEIYEDVMGIRLVEVDTNNLRITIKYCRTINYNTPMFCRFGSLYLSKKDKNIYTIKNVPRWFARQNRKTLYVRPAVRCRR